MGTLRRGKHIARGRAKRHPGIVMCRIPPVPCKGKSIYVREGRFVFKAFALTGRWPVSVLNPGCRFALPRAMCLLPLRGVSLIGVAFTDF